MSTRTDAAALRAWCAALALAVLAPAGAARAAIIEEIVAKANNRIITKSEFEERAQVTLKQVYEKYSGADLDREVQNAQAGLLANLITESLLLERAEAMFDMDKVRQSLIEDFRKQQKVGSDKDLEKLLVDQQMTRKDLEEQLIRLAVPNEIINHEVRHTISVSDREVKEYYDAHLKEWETPATVTFREIVLFYDPASEDEVQKRAAAIVTEARGDADFQALVQRESQAGTKEEGGLLGPLQSSDLHEAISAAAFALEPGQVSDPIDTGKSFHVIRLEAKTPKLVKAMEEIKDTVADAVRQEKFSPLFDKYIRMLWKGAHVEVSPNYERFLIVSPLKPKASG